jgi:hypothetical protein
MILKRTRFGAFVALTAGVLGMSLMASVPASAAPASHTAVSGHPKPIASSAIPAGMTKAFTITAQRTTTPGHVTPNATGPSIQCTMYVSGLTLIQPGEFWGPYEELFINYVGAGGAAVIVCNLPVAEIDVTGDVQWYSGHYTGQTLTYHNTLETDWSYSFVYGCAAGPWQSGGYGTIVLPPGYAFPGGATTYSWNYHGPVDNLTNQECIPS